MRLALLLLLSTLTFNGLAQDCGADSAQRVARAYEQRDRTLLPERPEWEVSLENSACRIWPADTSLTLIAVPVWPNTSERNAAYEVDLDLLVVDSRSLHPRASLRLSGALKADGFNFMEVMLDTARYQLSSHLRAFGVSIERKVRSNPSPYGDKSLQLFMLDGNAIKPLTQPMLLAVDIGEWDTKCDGQFTQTDRTLEIGRMPTHGLADILVRERGSRTVNRAKVEDSEMTCSSKEHALPRRSYRLRAQGLFYPLPEALKVEL